MTRHTTSAIESSVNLILAIRNNVKDEIKAVDAKIAKREKEIAELREERTTLIQMAGAAGVNLSESPTQQPLVLVAEREGKPDAVSA